MRSAIGLQPSAFVSAVQIFNVTPAKWFLCVAHQSLGFKPTCRHDLAPAID
jgi:hypothetical protein